MVSAPGLVGPGWHPEQVPGLHIARYEFDWKRDPVDHGLDPAYPARPGLAHAVEQKPKRGDVEFIEYSLPAALCGLRVRLVERAAFNPASGDACTKCAARAEGRRDPGPPRPAPRPLTHTVGDSAVRWYEP